MHHRARKARIVAAYRTSVLKRYRVWTTTDESFVVIAQNTRRAMEMAETLIAAANERGRPIGTVTAIRYLDPIETASHN